MKHILVIYTGGTIGMTQTEQGLKPKDGLLEEISKTILPTALHGFPNITFITYDPIIDSSEMTPFHWNKIAKDIYKNYAKYDGFVVLHGTDTIAYTGSALSFMLQRLTKPIILTGSQVPLCNAVTDARENFINAIILAANYPIYEVCVYFNQNLYRANRVTKYSTQSYNAYRSPNCPVLGCIGSEITLNYENLLPAPPVENIQFTPFQVFDIRCIRLMPNNTAESFAQLIKGADAVILETFGDGNFRTTTEFLKIISDASESGMVIINKSQCLNSKTQTELYESGYKLEQTGMISAGDQTLEALLCKLHYLLSIELPREKMAYFIKTNMCGETTSLYNRQNYKQPHYSPLFFSIPPAIDKNSLKHAKNYEYSKNPPIFSAKL